MFWRLWIAELVEGTYQRVFAVGFSAMQESIVVLTGSDRFPRDGIMSVLCAHCCPNSVRRA